jgi:hypothetical protein
MKWKRDPNARQRCNPRLEQYPWFFSTLLHQPLSESTVSEAAGIEPTLQRKSPLYIPFLGIARPQTQFTFNTPSVLEKKLFIIKGYEKVNTFL